MLQTRNVAKIWDVFSKLGGIIHILKIIANQILKRYALECYDLEAINDLIENNHDHEEIQIDDKPISFCQRLFLLAHVPCTFKK